MKDFIWDYSPVIATGLFVLTEIVLALLLAPYFM